MQGFCVVAFFFGIVPVANERALAALLRDRTFFLDVYKRLLLRNGLRRRVGSKLIGDSKVYGGTTASQHPANGAKAGGVGRHSRGPVPPVLIG